MLQRGRARDRDLLGFRTRGSQLTLARLFVRLEAGRGGWALKPGWPGGWGNAAVPSLLGLLRCRLLVEHTNTIHSCTRIQFARRFPSWRGNEHVRTTHPPPALICLYSRKSPAGRGREQSPPLFTSVQRRLLYSDTPDPSFFFFGLI